MYEIREMNEDDYDPSIILWQNTDGIRLSGADSRESIGYFLKRNPGLSFVCTHQELIIGTILCGHDGRRGYIYHVTVAIEHRGKSLGKKLVSFSLMKLKDAGIVKCHIMVIADNIIGNRFWNIVGWERRDGIFLYSQDT